MDRTGDKKTMILNRKSGGGRDTQSRTYHLVERPNQAGNKDKIPIIIKDMQLTLKKY